MSRSPGDPARDDAFLREASSREGDARANASYAQKPASMGASPATTEARGGSRNAPSICIAARAGESACRNDRRRAMSARPSVDQRSEIVVARARALVGSEKIIRPRVCWADL